MTEFQEVATLPGMLENQYKVDRMCTRDVCMRCGLYTPKWEGNRGSSMYCKCS